MDDYQYQYYFMRKKANNSNTREALEKAFPKTVAYFQKATDTPLDRKRDVIPTGREGFEIQHQPVDMNEEVKKKKALRFNLSQLN